MSQIKFGDYYSQWYVRGKFKNDYVTLSMKESTQFSPTRDVS